MTPLMPVDDALARVLASAEGQRQPVVSMSLLPALGRVLAEDIISSMAVPGDDNSAMDGYALRAADDLACHRMEDVRAFLDDFAYGVIAFRDPRALIEKTGDGMERLEIDFPDRGAEAGERFQIGLVGLL